VKILRDSERPWSDFCLYWSDKYLGFHFPLHSGWQSHPRIPVIGGGWEYYEAAILYGNKTTGEHRWYRLPKVIVPAKIVHLWRMRKRGYRNAWKDDRPMKAND